MLGQEILIEIDTTLDQLIRNAEAIQNVEMQKLSETEISAFQKTQESLVHHLLYMDQRLETERKSLQVQDKRSVSYRIQEKLLKFEKLESRYSKNLSRYSKKTPILSKRRTKKLLGMR